MKVITNGYEALVELWLAEENQSTLREISPTAHLSTTYPMWTSLGLNLGLWSEAGY
jgi:hypothetical protein